MILYPVFKHSAARNYIEVCYKAPDSPGGKLLIWSVLERPAKKRTKSFADYQLGNEDLNLNTLQGFLKWLLLVLRSKNDSEKKWRVIRLEANAFSCKAHSILIYTDCKEL